MRSYAVINIHLRTNVVRCSHVLSYALRRSQVVAEVVSDGELRERQMCISDRPWRGMLFAFVGACARCLRNVAPIRPLRIRARP